MVPFFRKVSDLGCEFLQFSQCIDPRDITGDVKFDLKVVKINKFLNEIQVIRVKEVLSLHESHVLIPNVLVYRYWHSIHKVGPAISYLNGVKDKGLSSFIDE
jgi:hypothetical protein